MSTKKPEFRIVSESPDRITLFVQASEVEFELTRSRGGAALNLGHCHELMDLLDTGESVGEVVEKFCNTHNLGWSYEYLGNI